MLEVIMGMQLIVVILIYMEIVKIREKIDGR